MAMLWNYIMSMYDEFEIQKLLLLLQKLASKKKTTPKPPPAHPKREWAALDTYKKTVGFVVVKGFNNSAGKSMALRLSWATKKKVTLLSMQNTGWCFRDPYNGLL